MLLLLGCALLQMVLARVLPSPWWVPDLLAAALVLTILRTPTRWLLLSTVTASITVLWAVRHGPPLFFSWLLAGGGVRVATTQWQLEEPRMLMALAGLVSLLTMSSAVWLDDLWSPERIGWMALRTLLTALSVPLLRRGDRV